MPRTRIRSFVAHLAVVLIAVACGGDDLSDQPGPEIAEPVIEVAADDAGHGATDQRDTIPGAVTDFAVPRLGDRFPWCTDVQQAWDSNADGLRDALAAATDFNEAAAVFRDAVDELDRAAALEEMDALEDRARDRFGAYADYESFDTRAGAMSAFRTEIDRLNRGAEGTKGVAYARAREAFEAAGSDHDSILLSEFLAILRASPIEERGYARLRALPMSPALEAAFAITDAQAARDAAAIPSTSGAAAATHTVRYLIDDTGYDDRVLTAVGAYADRTISAHLWDVDIRPALEATLAEAADYGATIQLAHDAATAAYNAVYDAAVAEHTAADGVFDVYEQDDARSRANRAASDAARPIIEEDLAALGAASDAQAEVFNAAVGAASDETIEALRALRDEQREAREDAWDEHRSAIYDALYSIGNASEQEARAAQDAAEAAATETLYTDTHRAVAEAVRVTGAHNLAAAAVAEAALSQFELGHIHVNSSSRSVDPGTFTYFIRTATAVETLIRSDAWSAFQTSVSEACR